MLFIAYYNAGSAALVLVVIFVALGTFFWCRVRRRRLGQRGVVLSTEEENIPLTQSEHNGSTSRLRIGEDDDYHSAKGKGREMSGEAIFDVGSDEEEDKRSR